jgi:hypothetical protein
MRAQSSESKGDERVPSWKLVALTATLLLFFVGPLILISWLWGGPGFCPAIPMMEIMTNINDKMSSPNPDGGADLVWGTGVCTIYLKPYDEDFDETESETNDFGVKIVMHEYVHCLQHGLVSGDADPAVRYDDIEVIVENPCGIPDVYVEKTKDAFVALPDAFRLVRKVVVFFACGGGQEYAQSDIETLVYGAGCPGMSAMKAPYANLNGFGEGDAEYLSLNVMMPSVVTSWETPFDGPAYWENRQAECRDDCGMPGQEAFRLGDLSETHVDERLIPSMRDAGFDGCRNNCIGEIVITFLLEERRPETTPDDVLALWRLAGKVGFGAAWESVTGESWRTFSAAFERDPEYTDDTQSEGSEGQALGTTYLDESLPAVMAGVTACLAVVACASLGGLGRAAQKTIAARRARGPDTRETIPK